MAGTWGSAHGAGRLMRGAGAAMAVAAGVALLTGCDPDDPTSTGAGPSQPGTASATPAATGTPAAGGCQSLVVSDQVKEDVTDAYRANAHLEHLQPSPGTFFYGACGTTHYAATRFDLTDGASFNEQVAHQDAGAMTKYFSQAANGTWTYLTSDRFPPDQHGCAAISQIPAQLATLWNDCQIHK